MVFLCRKMRSMPFRRPKLFLLMLIILTSVVTYSQLGAFESANPRHPTDEDVSALCWSQNCSQRPQRSLTRCHLTCGPTHVVWPQPTGDSEIGPTFSPFLLNHVVLDDKQIAKATQALLREAFEVFKSNLKPSKRNREANPQLKLSLVRVAFRKFQSDEVYLSLDTIEGYALTVKRRHGNVEVSVVAASFFGARHALETLSQLIWWEEQDGVFNMADDVTVVDKPRFPYRGLMIDTARHFMPMTALRRTVDGMAASKLNVLHLHLTDSQSFSFGSRQYPQMSRFGAYSDEQVHTAADLEELTEYARVRGVRILPEIDAPAHAGLGWQWGVAEGLGELAVCVEEEPWTSYCGEPPCGQLNPVNTNTYKVLQGLYEELVEATHVTDLFHVGGDEVNANCWKKTPAIFPRGENTANVEVQDMLTRFHRDAYESLQLAHKGKPMANVIVWSTNEQDGDVLTNTYPPEAYIIQVWGPPAWDDLYRHINNNYRVIISSVQAWYLDCGYGSWMSHRDTCSPVSSWQNVYMHRPWDDMSKDQTDLVLGGEVCLWSEKVSPEALDTRVWPRAAAVAERLWSDSSYNTRDWSSVLNDATIRLALHRERLVERGIGADAIWPQWCNRHPEACFQPKIVFSDNVPDDEQV